MVVDEGYVRDEGCVRRKVEVLLTLAKGEATDVMSGRVVVSGDVMTSEKDMMRT